METNETCILWDEIFRIDLITSSHFIGSLLAIVSSIFQMQLIILFT